MATEAAEEVPVPAAVAEAAATTGAEKQPHKLERKWAFWFDNQSKPKQGAAWGITLRKVYTFDTVEEFWCLYDQIFKPSKLPGNADFHLFKAGIEPKWEDPECANGGKWTVLSSPSNRRTNFENMWLETLMALIGEQFDDSDEICGVVASVRQRQDKLALWTKTATNEAAQVFIIGIVDTLNLNVFLNFICSRMNFSSFYLEISTIITLQEIAATYVHENMHNQMGNDGFSLFPMSQ
ncbi:eukaryotic translation initiation factor-like isoform X1 [Hibiscus syriacus]|uniref:eukaryotic translation initiation factor-like isoform X1 n=1 Tax=Hibiscus syriacus TaxID=106335 RepID=UPI001921E73F|nr:eukaryotic translation initiation factor-like isoform X1 [Hibiscus syriacus]